MASGVKISQLPVASTANSDSIFVMVQGDNTLQVAGSTLLNFFGGGGNGNVVSVTLETNGTLNNSQSLLNLTNGNNVTVTDNGAGIISISANSVSFKNNGNLNSSQTSFNLISGNNIVITDTGAGNISISSTASSIPQGLVIVPVVGSVAQFNGSNGSSQSLTLTSNVTSTASNFSSGSPILILIKQNSTGNWTFTWPSNFKNPPNINMIAGGATTQSWMQDETGNFYPFGTAVWSST